jgi:hypothetical protein
MPERKDCEFSRHIGALCVRANTNVVNLGKELGIDPVELLRMFNGYAVPTKAVIAGLARELDSDVRYLERLAAEIKPGWLTSDFIHSTRRLRVCEATPISHQLRRGLINEQRNESPRQFRHQWSPN